MIEDLLKHFINAPEQHVSQPIKEKLIKLEGLESKELIEELFDVMNSSEGISKIMTVTLKSVLTAGCMRYKYNYDEMLKESQNRCDKRKK